MATKPLAKRQLRLEEEVELQLEGGDGHAQGVACKHLRVDHAHHADAHAAVHNVRCSECAEERWV